MSTGAFSEVERGLLASGIPADLVHELLEAFTESKRRYFLGDFRPNAVEGGRFSEAALRILQWQASGTYTALSDSHFKAESVITFLSQQAAGSIPDSVRLHIPRAIRVVYDIRNKRNTAHLSDGIDPNVQDAALVINTLDWILAELVRLHHNVSAGDAQELIEAIVSREVPMIQVFDGMPRILKDLPASDHCLVLLYWAGQRGTTRQELSDWLPVSMRTNLTRTLNQLHAKHKVHFTPPAVQLTRVGERDVEARKLIQPL
ncbi:hypothetical protein [Herbiconiux sp. YIM B11900]|uniref:hypothetical protein n=1 Tax=Herbiconiux sp. YIM B11900 TaxID=3404131 RepID=UPI003F857B77